MMSTDQTLDSPSLAPQNTSVRRRHGLRPLPAPCAPPCNGD
jgi:hypothetical protein